MKKLIFITLSLLPIFSLSQTQVLLKSGKVINAKVNSFLGKSLIFNEKIESIESDRISIFEITQLNGLTPEYRKKAILKKNSAIIFNDEIINDEIIKKEHVDIAPFLNKSTLPDSLSYKAIRITLNSGKTLKTKKILLFENKVSFTNFNLDTKENTLVSYNIDDIKSIKATSKTAVIPGFLIGSGIGTISMLIAAKLTKKSIHEYSSTPSSETWYDYERSMNTRGKITIVAGGALLGTMTGLLIKGGWKTLFPQKTSLTDNIDFDFYQNPVNVKTSGLTVNVHF